ncbi:endo alpha-1,4 polygalactosaminidase [Micromonospora sp. WMMD754]|uniref:endo alpha-1,4 polygalactosaminidase n=1 Tax=Micromonospora sp. WMMD754 TaxID=3404114 RepID=UPI003BF4A635
MLGLLALAVGVTLQVTPQASAGQRQPTGSTATDTADRETRDQAAPAAISPPPANATFDYQIGGAYPPPSGVRVVSRDREDPPAAGLYNICYINAFQTQPQETAWWKSNHDDLLLRDASGRYVIDSAWNEILLDTRTDAKRTRLAAIVNGWVDGCAARGFHAVEPDNIDSYGRSRGLLTQSGAVAYLELLADHAHQAGLAIAQKNSTELGVRGRDVGLDFAVAEECARYDECDAYTRVYGTNVIVIEYTDKAFAKACRTVGGTLSVVRRDLNVTRPGSRTYRYDPC